MPKEINSKNFDALVLDSELPVVVDVWADWCGPCKMIAPHFAAAEEELKGTVRFVKLDADKNQKLLRKYQIMGIPTLLYFKDGQLVDRSTGVATKAAILRKAKALLESEEGAESKPGLIRRLMDMFKNS